MRINIDKILKMSYLAVTQLIINNVKIITIRSNSDSKIRQVGVLECV